MSSRWYMQWREMNRGNGTSSVSCHIILFLYLKYQTFLPFTLSAMSYFISPVSKTSWTLNSLQARAKTFMSVSQFLIVTKAKEVLHKYWLNKGKCSSVTRSSFLNILRCCQHYGNQKEEVCFFRSTYTLKNSEIRDQVYMN